MFDRLRRPSLPKVGLTLAIIGSALLAIVLLGLPILSLLRGWGTLLNEAALLAAVAVALQVTGALLMGAAQFPAARVPLHRRTRNG
jgi:hypothetical protein